MEKNISVFKIPGFGVDGALVNGVFFFFFFGLFCFVFHLFTKKNQINANVSPVLFSPFNSPRNYLLDLD